MKKAAIQPLFKYIFVVIAGSIILLFFINLAANQLKISSKLSSTELAKSLDDDLNAFSVSEDSDKTINLGTNTILNLDYDADCNSFISVKDSMPIKKNKIVFSPKKLNGNKIHAWTQSWKYPYKAVNFFYLSNPKSKYYLIGDNDLARELSGIRNMNTGNCCENFEYIPQRFNIEQVDSVGEIDPSGLNNYDFVKLIFIDTAQSQSSFSGADEVISITTNNCLENQDDENCHGTVTFEDGTNIFMGKPMLYGAIFAESLGSYNCALGNALDKLDKVTDIYKNKANRLRALTAEICEDPINRLNKYHNLMIILDNLQNLIREQLSAIMLQSTSLHLGMQDLRDYNNRELGGINCVTLF